MRIDSSQLKCFINCNKKYFNNYVRQITKTEYAEDSVDTSWGNAIHLALEHFYKTGRTDMPGSIKIFSEAFTDLDGETVKTKANGIEILKLYENYDKYNFSEWEILATEQKGEFTIGDITYIVKVDMVVRINGNIYIVDFKTSKINYKYNYMDRFKLNIQPTGYIIWCKEAYGQCAGFIPVALFVGFTKRSPKKGVPAGFHGDFDFTIINRTEEDIEDFKRETIIQCDRILECNATGIWTKNMEHCSSYRGCQYKQLCESHDDEFVMNELYAKYNPFKYLGE